MRNPDLCHATLRIGGFVFQQLESVSGHEAIGEPFRYVLRAAQPLPLPRPSALLGVPASLTLTDEYGERTVHGVAAEVETFATDKDRGEVRVVFLPKTHPLTLGRASRSFQDLSAIDVVEKIVTPACPVVRSLSRPYPAVPYRVQREEDDWSFVVRTLEADRKSVV